MLEIFFWVLIGLLFYTFLGYPLLLLVAGHLRSRPAIRDNVLRTVDLVIPVHNGARELAEKLDNCLALNYPSEKLRIFVVSDGSTDETVAIAGRYSDRGVACVDIPERVGKVEAQNRILPQLTSELVVFTDVGIRVSADALKNAVSNFADPTVGVVSCRDEIQTSGRGPSGDSFYIQYDMLVRQCSMRLGSLIGVTGGFYVLRRHLTDGGWDPAYPPDFYVALRAIKNGLRAVEDQRVKAYYLAAGSDDDELKRKVRTITRGMWALFSNCHLMNPFRYGWPALQLISHKLLRWTVPLIILTLFF